MGLSNQPIEFDDVGRDESARRQIPVEPAPRGPLFESGVSRVSRDGNDPSAPAPSPWNARLVLMAPLASYALFIAKSVAGPVNVTWALLLLLWALAATVLAWRLTR